MSRLSSRYAVVMVCRRGMFSASRAYLSLLIQVQNIKSYSIILYFRVAGILFTVYEKRAYLTITRRHGSNCQLYRARNTKFLMYVVRRKGIIGCI